MAGVGPGELYRSGAISRRWPGVRRAGLGRLSGSVTPRPAPLDSVRPNLAAPGHCSRPGRAAEQSAFRFSGERPSPHESTTVRLIRPDDLLGHLGVQDRPHVSTAVVSTALAAGLCIRRPLTFRFRGGESSLPNIYPGASLRLDALALASSSRSQRARSPTTALTPSDLPRTVRGGPLASAGVCGGCYSLSYSPAKGAWWWQRA